MSDPNSQFGTGFVPQMQSSQPYYFQAQPRMNMTQYPGNPHFIHAMPGGQQFQHYYSQMGGSPAFGSIPHAIGPQYPHAYSSYMSSFNTNVPPAPTLFPYMQPQPYQHSAALPTTTTQAQIKPRSKNILSIMDPTTKQEIDLTSINSSPINAIVPDTTENPIAEIKSSAEVETVTEDITPAIVSVETKEEYSVTNAPIPNSNENVPIEQKTPVNGFLESHEDINDIPNSDEVEIATDDLDEITTVSSSPIKSKIHHYTQQELLEIRKLPSCLKAPPNFPDIPGVTLLHDLDFEDIAGMDQQVESMIKIARGSDSFRNVNRGGGYMNRRFPQPNVTIHIKEVGFREAASVYKPLFKGGGVESQKEQLKRQIQALLNKLTPENFEKIQSKISKLEINTTADLEMLCNLIFEKATTEKAYGTVFAKLCYVLKDQLSVRDEEDSTKLVYFRQPLIKFCQTQFETKFEDYMQQQENKINETIEKENDERTKAILLSNKQDQLRKKELQYYGNMNFIGELLRMQILRPTIFFYCTKQLMVENNTALDCLCELYTTVGELVDKKVSNWQDDLNLVFKFFEEQTKNEKLESRIRFKLLDLIELRQRKWKKRDVQLQLQSGPKTLAEMQEASRKEEDEKTKALRTAQRLLKDVHPPMNYGPQQSRHPLPSNPRNVKPTSLVLSFQSFDQSNIVLGPSKTSSWAQGSGGGKQKPQDNRKGDTSGESWKTVTEERKGRQVSMRQDTRNRTASPLSTSNRFSLDCFNLPKTSSTHSSGHSTPTLQQMESSYTGSMSFPEAKLATGRSSPTPSASEDSASVRDRNEQDQYSDDALRRKADWALSEYMSTGVLEGEFYAVPLQYHALYITQLIYSALESNDATRTRTGEFIRNLVENGIFSENSLNEGINLMLSQCFEYDLETDIPDFWKYMGTILQGLIHDEKSRLGSLANLNADPSNLAKMWSHLLIVASKRLTPSIVGHVFRASDLSWEILLPGYDVSSFIENENLQFTLQENVLPNPLREILITMDDQDNEAVFDEIDTYLENGTTLSSDSLSAIVEFVLCSAFKANIQVFQTRIPVLKKYATSDCEVSKKTEDIIVCTLERLRSESNWKIYEEVLILLSDNRLISQELLKLSERTS